MITLKNAEDKICRVGTNSQPYFSNVDGMPQILSFRRIIVRQNKIDIERIKFMTKREFPSLYSLDPQTSTIADAAKCVDAGCDPDEPDASGEWGAVAWLAVSGSNDYTRNCNAPLIRFLLKTCKPKRASLKNDVPLFSRVKNHEIAEALLDYGFDVDETDKSGRTALMLLSEGSCSDPVLHLIRRGADVNKKDNNGRTALDYAVEYGKPFRGRLSVMEALFENGAKAGRPRTLNALAKSVPSQEKIDLLEKWTDFSKEEIRAALEKNPAGRELSDAFAWQPFKEWRDDPFADMDYRIATTEDVKNALDKGGNPNDFDGCRFLGAFFLATARNSDAVKYLFERCPDLCLYTAEWGGMCYKTILSHIKDPEIARIVTENAPETLTEFEYGTMSNPIGVAARSNTDPEFIRRLANLGVPVKIPYDSEDKAEEYSPDPYYLPLEEAVLYNENPEILQVLLDSGCDVRKKVVLQCLRKADISIKKAEILLSTGLFTTDQLLSCFLRSGNGKVWGGYGSYRQRETDVRDIRTNVLDSPMIVNALKFGTSKLIVAFLNRFLPNPNWRSSNWETPLMIAVSAKRDNSIVIRDLLEAGADPTLKNNDGVTVLETDTTPENKKSLDEFMNDQKWVNSKRP